VLFIDEVDGVEKLLSTGEGKWVEVLMGHTFSWGARKKIAMFSSPTTDEESLIKEYHAMGDRRVFLIPCPYCGELIELKLLVPPGTPWGLHADTKGGEIDGAYYICENCGEPIYDYQKRDFYSDHPRCLKHPKKEVPVCRWKPTAKPSDPCWRSYGMNALYSPVGMLSFAEVYKKQADVELSGSSEDRRSFVNIYAGEEYKDVASRPRLSAVLNHRGAYPRGTVPPGALFLTMACDVQRGSSRDHGSPSRVEIEVMATGLGYRTWSVEYLVFPGETDNAYSGAWEDLYDWMKKNNGTFYNQKGIPFQIVMIGIDSGDAADGRSEAVYRFAERWHPFAFPLKGFARLSARRGEKADIPGSASFKKYRMAKIGTGGEQVIEVSTAFYKATLFSRLNIEPYTPSKPAYCEFPRDYPDDYFVQLTNSERRSDGSFRDIGAHEALDCRIYNLMLSDAYLASRVNIAKEQRRSAGMDPMSVELMTNSRFILDHLQKEIDAYGAGKP
jgi:phage terminase large subunit GpA-like protein